MIKWFYPLKDYVRLIICSKFSSTTKMSLTIDQELEIMLDKAKAIIEGNPSEGLTLVYEVFNQISKLNDDIDKFNNSTKLLDASKILVKYLEREIPPNFQQIVDIINVFHKIDTKIMENYIQSKYLFDSDENSGGGLENEKKLADEELHQILDNINSFIERMMPEIQELIKNTPKHVFPPASLWVLGALVVLLLSIFLFARL
ncbi:hypothetical protein TRFO_31386 [Tritrichomonas foetus]|uniref:Uncharacterized protein n=1 Tax=Tritrichomonas foetus TaxID=1144522 RepID=A0A1J4JRN9_9EUKA|nr:hypothetical protein TRFO_31386 [Tritrichomonas foetus]|eukprot:OHT01691.1 hypothetical protein TRFO_31386 [Tritrichomonas foetus]